MRYIPKLIVLWLLLILGMHIGMRQVRIAAQHNKTLHQIVLSVDMFDFITTGGGIIGYDNYFKWAYAKTLQTPELPIWKRILFTPIGPGALAYCCPPKEYPYPPLYDENL